jgi:iron complex outermembrane receptor protein
MVEDFHAMAATIEVGGRLNRDDYSPKTSAAPGRNFSTWSLSGSALWDFNTGNTLGLSVSRSQRAPSAEELYSNFGLGNIDDCVIHAATGSCELGNVDFSEETSLNTDLTLYLDQGSFNATITAFYNRFDDYIAQVSTGQEVAGFPVHQYQQDDARFSGVEVDINFQLTDLAGLRLFGDAIKGSLDNQGDAPRMPPNRIGAEIRFDSTRWSAWSSVIHAFAQDKPGNNELGSDSWTRVDIGADYTFDTGNAGELMLFITGRNLGNSEIRLATSYLRGFAPETGRSLETGIRYLF